MSIAVSFSSVVLTIPLLVELNLSSENFLSPTVRILCIGGDPSGEEKIKRKKSGR